MTMSSQDVLIVVANLMGAIAVGTLLMLVMARQQRSLVETWLRDRGLSTVKLRRQILPCGPFKGAPPAGNYGIYRVVVTDRLGRECRGWVRVTTPFIWLKPRYDATWNGQPPSDLAS